MKNYVYIFLIAMVPLIELRGAIPVAYAINTANPDFSLLWSYIIIAIGNILPVPFIYLFARKILEWGKDKKVIGKFFTWCLEKGEKGGQKLQAKAGRGLYWALVLFVGIPLPGTGAWTGTLAASFLDMGFKKSVIAVIGGVVLASVIVGVVCTLGFGAFFGIS
ncbi:MAG: small multi-drug export protein [Bacteroidales bacterium]|nr:small multi-drug export protein [Bacteroidales bacterium]MBR4838564.1 small multi-drug export protein [Bacteroidales bacterium]